MFPLFTLLKKVIQKLKFTQECEVILIAPGDRQNRCFHTYSVSVWTTIASFHTGRTYCHNRCIGRQVVPSACMEALMQHFQAAGFSKEVPRLAAPPRRPSINRIYDDRWLRFTYCAAGQGIDSLGHTAA